MANLPMDIVYDLFLRLSASVLVRFRLLSKPCISLIDSPVFVKSHLKRTLETGNHLMILMRFPSGILRTVYLDAPDKVTNIEHPLQQYRAYTQIFGSCNGLIGLQNSPVDMALFNPSTRKTHRLPVDLPECSLVKEDLVKEDVMYGFGYDSVSQDYKVLRMVHRKRKFPTIYTLEVKVFSLKRNEWKRVSMDEKIERVFFLYYYNVRCRPLNGVLVNNCLHWLLPPVQGGCTYNTVVRFDLGTEDFGMLHLPNFLRFKDNMDVAVLDGCLCLRYSYTQFKGVDVWIMKEYKVEGYWTELFGVTEPEIVEAFEFARPLVYSKDRNKVLLEIDDGKLVWFDLVSKSCETFAIKGCDDSLGAQVVVSSLVLGCNGDPHNAETSNKRDDGILSKGFNVKL